MGRAGRGAGRGARSKQIEVGRGEESAHDKTEWLGVKRFVS